MKNKKLIFILSGIVLAIALIVFGTVTYFNSKGYVAKVGSEKITTTEYNFFLGSIKMNMEQTVQAQGADLTTFWNSKIDGKDAKEVAKTKALDEAQKFKIQLIKAKESGLKLEAADKTKIITSIDDQVKQLGNTEVENQLKQTYGITLKQYKDIILDLNLVGKYADQEENKITLTDADYQEAYKGIENADKATVRHILIMTVDQSTQQPLPQDKQDEAKKKADDVLAKVKAGGNMKELAAQYSEDPGSKDNSGQYTISKGEMVKEFEDWSFSAKPGDTGIVKSTYGYHVMQKPKFEDLKESLKADTLYGKYIKGIEELKKDSKFDIIKNQKVYDSIVVA